MSKVTGIAGVKLHHGGTPSTEKRPSLSLIRIPGVQVSDANRVVFVVDDEAVIARTLAIILNHAGYHASAFDHPEKAVAALAQVTPALLISDVTMPGMTGIELAIHFRKAQPECRILLFSGQASSVDLLKEARADGYDFDLLSKPIHPEHLLAILRN